MNDVVQCTDGLSDGSSATVDVVVGASVSGGDGDVRLRQNLKW